MGSGSPVTTSARQLPAGMTPSPPVVVRAAAFVAVFRVVVVFLPVVALAVVALAVVALAVVFFAAVDFLAGAFFAAAFLVAFYFTGARSRRSTSSSAARSRVMVSGSSPLRRLALDSPSVT